MSDIHRTTVPRGHTLPIDCRYRYSFGKPTADAAGDGWVLCSIEQLFWLANLPIKDQREPGVLERFYAAEVYEAIIEAGHRGAIPIDRRVWILEEEYVS